MNLNIHRVAREAVEAFGTRLIKVRESELSERVGELLTTPKLRISTEYQYLSNDSKRCDLVVYPSKNETPDSEETRTNSQRGQGH